MSLTDIKLSNSMVRIIARYSTTEIVVAKDCKCTMGSMYNVHYLYSQRYNHSIGKVSGFSESMRSMHILQCIREAAKSIFLVAWPGPGH